MAADLIGPLRSGSDVVGLVVGAGLLSTLAWLRSRCEVPPGGRVHLVESGLGLASTCAAVNDWGLTPRIKAVQAE